MRYLYNFLVAIASVILPLLGIFSKKIKRNLLIRKNLKIHLPPGKVWYWFHAASVGEYEQARALAVLIKKKMKNAGIVMSVYSESAYSQRKDDTIHDIFFALPLDTKNQMRKIAGLIKPRAVFFSKYDVWPNLVFTLHEMSIPVFLISATLPDKSARQKGLQKKFLRNVYSQLSGIYAIHEEHKQRFAKWGLTAVVTGDTRFDAIHEKLQNPGEKVFQIRKLLSPNLKKFGYKVIVAGSTYPASQEMIMQFLARDTSYFVIMAPHHVRQENLEIVRNQLRNYQLSAQFLSGGDKIIFPTTRILVIDSMGLLPHLYALGGIAYIGGAFEGSVHSVIEPIISGALPITGPHIRNSQEALDMQKANLLQVLAEPDPILLENYLKSINQTSYQKKSGELRAFFRQRQGATTKIFGNLPADLWQKPRN